MSQPVCEMEHERVVIVLILPETTLYLLYLCIGMRRCCQPRLLEQVCGSSAALGKQVQDIDLACSGRNGRSMRNGD